MLPRPAGGGKKSEGGVVGERRDFLEYQSEEDTRKVLRLHQKEIARFIHAQMQNHHWEEVVGYDVVVSKGFTELKSSAFTASVKDPPLDLWTSPDEWLDLMGNRRVGGEKGETIWGFSGCWQKKMPCFGQNELARVEKILGSWQDFLFQGWVMGGRVRIADQGSGTDIGKTAYECQDTFWKDLGGTPDTQG